MKISGNIKENKFKCYNEARSIAKNKRQVLLKQKVCSWPFWATKFLVFAIFFVLGFILVLNDYLFLANIVILGDILYLALNLLRVILSLTIRDDDIVLTFNKEGIIDESYMGIKMIFKWEKIKAIVFGEYSITILTDTPYYFFLDIKNKKKVLEVLNKYSKDILIVK